MEGPGPRNSAALWYYMEGRHLDRTPGKRIRDPERNLRILESMRKNGEEFGPREQYYYEMERAFAGDAGEAALENGQLLTQPRNERFVNGRYLW